MKSIQKSEKIQPITFELSNQLPSISKIQNLKEEAQDDEVVNSINEIELFDKKETIDWLTHPTVGVETLSEANIEMINNKINQTPSKHIKQEVTDDLSESKQNSDALDYITVFLRDINFLSRKIFSREEELNTKIAELRKELELLQKSKETASLLYKYMSDEKMMKDFVKQVLETGSTNFDNIVALPPFSTIPVEKQEVDENCEANRSNQNEVSNDMCVYEEYDNEKEEFKNLRKRDLKCKRKQENEDLLNDTDHNYDEVDLMPNDYYCNYIPPYNYEAWGQQYNLYPIFDENGEYHYNNEYNFASPKLNENPAENENKFVGQDKNTYHNNSLPVTVDWELANNCIDGLNPNPYLNREIGPNCELIGKVQNSDHLLYNDFMNNDPDKLFKEEKEEEKFIKCENDSDWDLFADHSQNQFQKKANLNNEEEFDDSDFEDSESESSDNADNSEYKSLFENSKEGDYSNSNQVENQHFDSNGRYFGEEMYNMDKMRHHDYYQNHDQIGMYMNPQGQHYGQEMYSIDQMINPLMYHDQMYPGAPMNYPYLKQEDEMANYMHMQQIGLDANSYYKGHKMHKSDIHGSKHIKDKSSNKGRKRSKYKMLPTDLKHKAVELAQQKGAKYSANFYSVPLKSLKRWMKVGCERKKGGGRKTKDPLMEKNLYNWYRDKKNRGEIITAKMIKEKAIELTNCNDFIASKGWLDKFKVRFNLEISKESSKDNSNKRRSLNDTIRKRRNDFEFLGNAYYGNDINHFQSYRRSLNKSIKQETTDINNHFFKEESDGIVVGGDSRYLNIPRQTHNVKREEWMEKNKGGKKISNDNLSSRFPSVLNENQFKNSNWIDKSCSNIINLPLCDENNSEDDYSYNI